MSKYLKVYEQIKNDIISGIYKFGDKIPSKRSTAENYGLSLITVEHAYDLLADESYIEPRERSGYYVIYDETSSYDSSVHEIKQEDKIENKRNEDFVPPSPLPFSIYSKTLKKVLTVYGEKALEKSPNAGDERLRLAISGYLGRSRHIKVSPDQIYIGAGAEYLYRLIVTVLGRDIVFGIESPSYSQITNIYNAENVKLEMLPLIKDGIDSTALWNSKARVLHITPYRSFPSRITASAAKKREYINWCIERNAFIIEDDCESEFSPLRKSEDTLFAINEDANVIYINTFTKTISPSLRMGYMVIPKRLEKIFKEKIGFYSVSVPTIEQLTVATLIEEGDFERHLNRMRREARNKFKTF